MVNQGYIVPVNLACVAGRRKGGVLGGQEEGTFPHAGRRGEGLTFHHAHAIRSLVFSPFPPFDACHAGYCQPINWSMAAMSGDSAAVAVVRARPRENHEKNQLKGFLFFPIRVWGSTCSAIKWTPIERTFASLPKREKKLAIGISRHTWVPPILPFD